MILASFIIMYIQSNNIKVKEIFQHKAFRVAARIIILYLFSLLFKSFDLSFPSDIGAFLLRGQLFSIMYVIFGLIVWEIGIVIARTIRKKAFKSKIVSKLILLCTALLLYGLAASFLFGLCYAAFDILLYHRYEAWDSVSSWSYDLIFGTYFFYLLILSYCTIVYYYKNWKESQLNEERLRRENIQAKYDVLKTQIDPHFFFNSLSVLTNLVYKSADLSAEYITHLAKCYRYILDKKFDNLVNIATELEFLDSYIYLIKIRHQNSISIQIMVPEEITAFGKVPPATLQMLLENAIKHNRFSSNTPLKISITHKGEYIEVCNDLKKRTVNTTSLGVGLDNIAKRYELTCDKKVVIKETETKFIVEVPIIYHENITI